VDLASETGTFGFDDVSLTPPFLAGSDKAVFDNSNHPFMVKLKSQLKKASDVKKEEYGLFFASAGHAALYDYPSATGLQSVAADIWARGGVVSAVCHGPVILPAVIDTKTGKSIIQGKTVTGFSVEGEMIFRILDKLKADKVLTVIEAVSRVGADYSSPMGPLETTRLLQAESLPAPTLPVRVAPPRVQSRCSTISCRHRSKHPQEERRQI